MEIIEITYPKCNCNHNRKVFTIVFGGEAYVLYLPVDCSVYSTAGEVPTPEISDDTIKHSIVNYLLGESVSPFTTVRHIIFDQDLDRRGSNIVEYLLIPSWKRRMGEGKEELKKIILSSCSEPEDKEEFLEIVEM